MVRYGGDEFLVLIEQTTFEDAWVVANKILQEIGSSELYIAELNENIHVSVSAGVAVGQHPGWHYLKKPTSLYFRLKKMARIKSRGEIL